MEQKELTPEQQEQKTELDKAEKERRESKLVRLQDVIDMLNEVDLRIHKTLKTRPQEQQRIIGDFVTVLFPEIMQDAKRIADYRSITPNLISTSDGLDGIRYYHLGTQITKEDYEEFEHAYKQINK